MIKFFRKIRQRLLTENKFSKYLLYAIGEIILVVIGILIALQVNNYNEAKKQEIKTKEILTKVHEELAINIQKSDDIIAYYKTKDSLFYLFFNDKFTIADYKENGDGEVIGLTFSYWILQIIDNAYKSLILQIGNMPKTFEPLIENLTTIYEENKKLVDNENVNMEKLVTEHYNSIMNKKWYTDFMIKNKVESEVFQYFLSDPNYRSHAASFYLEGIETHLRLIQIFRSNAIRSFKEITDLLGLQEKVKDANYPFIINIEDYLQWVGIYEWTDTDTEITLKFEILIEEETLYFKQEKYSIKSEIFPLYNGMFYFENWFGFFKVETNTTGDIVGIRTYRGWNQRSFKKIYPNRD